MSVRMLRTAYTVKNMERSLAFYRDLLGLRVVRDKLRAGESYDRILGITNVELRVVLLEDGASGHLLELAEFISPPTQDRVVRDDEVGSSNICFVVDDLDSCHQRLIEAGVTARCEPADFVQEGRTVGRIAAVFDPDRIPVLLLEKSTT